MVRHRPSLIFIALIFVEACRNRGSSFSRNLAFSALVLALGFVLLPQDRVRLGLCRHAPGPLSIAVALLAIRFKGPTAARLGTVLAVIAILFCAVRLGATTYSLAIAAKDQQAKLTALDTFASARVCCRLTASPAARCGRCPATAIWARWSMVRRRDFRTTNGSSTALNLMDRQIRGAPGYFGRSVADRPARPLPRPRFT